MAAQLRITDETRWAVLFVVGIVGFFEQMIGALFRLPIEPLILWPSVLFAVGAPTASALMATWRGTRPWREVDDGSDERGFR